MRIGVSTLMVALTTCAVSGCVSQRVVQSGAPVTPSTQAPVAALPATHVAPVTGVYKLKWLDRSNRLHPVADIDQVVLLAGDTFGFSTDNSGRLIAVARDRTIALPAPPSSAKACLWYCKTKTTSHFGRTLDKSWARNEGAVATVMIPALFGGYILQTVPSHGPFPNNNRIDQPDDSAPHDVSPDMTGPSQFDQR
jgi:hypothetical protein